jgi:hypothetical protein
MPAQRMDGHLPPSSDANRVANVHAQRMDIDAILERHRETLGRDFNAYRNHAHRVAHYCFTLHAGDENDRDKIAIAASFHDLGIWTHRTFDYLEPSIALANAYLRENGLDHYQENIETMIALHHKIRPEQHPLVEAFRKSDLVDVSWGFLRCGLTRADIRGTRAAFPNAGFHKLLMNVAARWISRHPLHPLPVIKW